MKSETFHKGELSERKKYWRAEAFFQLFRLSGEQSID